MRDYNTLSRNLNYPTKPKKVEPKREAFNNNTEWGIALDAYETQFAMDMDAYKVAMASYHDQAASLDAEFWAELYEELGWNTLPEKVAGALQGRAWESGHSAGYGEVYCHASDFASLVDAIKDELEKAQRS